MAYDVVIIGSGPGGHMCAVRAAQLGLKVAVVEKKKLGGVCSNTGCIPTKALASCAELARKMKSAESYGVRASGVEFDFATALRRARNAASMVSQGVGLLLKSHGVEVVQGEGTVESPAVVRVGEMRLETKNIVIATGGYPVPFPGVAFGGTVISGEEVMALESAPKSVIIIGGGVEGAEYAGIFASFGIPVTVIELLDRIIAQADREASELVAKSLAGMGVKILTGTKVERVEGGAVYANGEKHDADLIIVSIGKRPNVGEDAKNIGVAWEKKGITVDARMRTSVPNVYAIGDAAGGGLAHVASEQGVAAAENIAGMGSEFDGRYPYCIFSVPEVAAVGDISGDGAGVGKFPFAALGRATASGDRNGFVKAFVKDGVVVGAVIAGPHASDLVGEAALAVRNKLTAEQVFRTIHAHPTFPEAFQEAVRVAEGKSLAMPKQAK